MRCASEGRSGEVREEDGGIWVSDRRGARPESVVGYVTSATEVVEEGLWRRAAGEEKAWEAEWIDGGNTIAGYA